MDPKPALGPSNTKQSLGGTWESTPSVKRYTLTLKITSDLRDKLEAMIGPNVPALDHGGLQPKPTGRNRI